MKQKISPPPKKKYLPFFYATFQCGRYNVFKCFFFDYKKLKKTPSKVAQKNSNPLFSLTARAAQMTKTEEFMVQNVA